jgi:hypothetical protein
MQADPNAMPQVTNPTPAPQSTNVFGDLVTTLRGFSPVAMAGAAAVPPAANDSTDIGGFDLTNTGAGKGLGPVSLNGFAPAAIATGSQDDPINQMTGLRNTPTDIGDIDNEAELQRQQNVFGLDGLVTLGGVPYASDSSGGFYNLRTGQEVSSPTLFAELKQGGDGSGIQPWNAASLAKQYNSGNFFGNVTNPVTEQGTMAASTPKLVDWTYSTGQQQSAVLSPEQPVTMGVGTGSEWASAMPVVTTGGQDMSDIRYAPGIGFIDAFGSGTEAAGDALGGVGSGYLWAQGTDYHTPDGMWITGQASANPTLATTSGQFLPNSGIQVLPSSLPAASDFTAPVASALGLLPPAQPSPSASPLSMVAGSEGTVANALMRQSLWPAELPSGGSGSFALTGANGTAINEAMRQSVWPTSLSTPYVPSAPSPSNDTSVGGFNFSNLLGLGATDLTLPLGGGENVGGILGGVGSSLSTLASDAWNDVGTNPITGKGWLDLQSPGVSFTPAQLNMSDSQAQASLGNEYGAWVNANLANNSYLTPTQLGYTQSQAKQNLDPLQYSVWSKVQNAGDNSTAGITVGSDLNPYADLSDWAGSLKGGWDLPAMIGSDVLSVLPAGIGLSGNMAGKVADIGQLGVEEGPISDMLGGAASKLSDAWDSGVEAARSSPLMNPDSWYTFGKITPPSEESISQDEKLMSDWSQMSTGDRIASRIASRDASAYTPPTPNNEPTVSPMTGKYDLISRIVNRDAAADASMKDIQWNYGADNAGTFFENLDKDLSTQVPQGFPDLSEGPTIPKPPVQDPWQGQGIGTGLGDGTNTGISIGTGLGDGGVPPTPPMPPIQGTLQTNGLGLPGNLFSFPDFSGIGGAGGTGGTGDLGATGDTGESIDLQGIGTPDITQPITDNYITPDLGDDEPAPDIPAVPLVIPGLPSVGASGFDQPLNLRYFTYKNPIWSFSPFSGQLGDFDVGGLGLGSSSMFDDSDMGASSLGSMDFSASAVTAGLNGAGNFFDTDMNDMGNSIGAAGSSGMFDVPAESFLNDDEADGMPTGAGYNDPYTVRGRRVNIGQTELEGAQLLKRMGDEVYVHQNPYDDYVVREWSQDIPWNWDTSAELNDAYGRIPEFKVEARGHARDAFNAFVDSSRHHYVGEDPRHRMRLATAEVDGKVFGVVGFTGRRPEPGIPAEDGNYYITSLAGSGRPGAGTRLLRYVAGEAAKEGTGLSLESTGREATKDFYSLRGGDLYINRAHDYSPMMFSWAPERTKALADGYEPVHQLRRVYYREEPESGVHEEPLAWTTREPQGRPTIQKTLNFDGRGYNPGAGYHHTTTVLDEPVGPKSIARAWKLAAEPGLRRKKFTTMWSGDEVDIVNGSYIRDTTTEDYLLGSNPQADPALVPPKHLYVSDINPKAPHGLHDLYGIVTHEGSESGAMKFGGLSYRPAHRLYGEKGEELFRNTVSANASEREMWLASNKIIAMETALAAKHSSHARSYGMDFEGVARTGYIRSALAYGIDTSEIADPGMSMNVNVDAGPRSRSIPRADYGGGFSAVHLDFTGLSGTGSKMKGFDYGDSAAGSGISFSLSDMYMGLGRVSAKTARKTMKDTVGDSLGFGLSAIGMGMGIDMGMTFMKEDIGFSLNNFKGGRR